MYIVNRVKGCAINRAVTTECLLKWNVRVQFDKKKCVFLYKIS